ncbi:MAG: glycosyltransferase family 4 protein [Deltaproteobacteria bacterium]|nr:glycosyltransferase family 4 protein [Deltaproteobacteria bacterium]
MMGTNKIHMIMPIGMNHGWGICGRYLTEELSKLCDIELITGEFSMNDVQNEMEFNHLNALRKKQNPLFSDDEELEYPVIQAIRGITMEPWYQTYRSPFRVGYTFFESDTIAPEAIDHAKAHFDFIVAGSSWCERILNEFGFENTRTIIQGIDPLLFHPNDTAKTLYEDKFVIFSGGKLELRKGQDLVIRAFKIMQDKYPDVMLVNLWYNHWTQSMESMALSPHIRFDMPKGDYIKAVHHLLSVNGIDTDRVITLPPKQNHELSAIYKNTDIGLFPNRCEGGTNLVLMEYMACGKPVIASYSSGHKDILSDRNSVPIKSMRPFVVQNQDNSILYTWDDPDLDEIISALEWAYWHRDKIKPIGGTAGEDLSHQTWACSAEAFYNVICGPSSKHNPVADPIDHKRQEAPALYKEQEHPPVKDPEKFLYDILHSQTGQGPITLRDMMKKLRDHCGEFSRTEAILHMMEALVIESTERRGW